MLTDKQLDIFGVFAKYPFKDRTRQEVKNLSSEKSNNALSIAFSQFREEDLLLETKVGKSSLYKLNLKNNLAYYYLALSNNRRLSKVVKLSLNHVVEEVRKNTSFFCVVVFGSYAVNEEKKSSDLDVAIIIEDRAKAKIIERNLSNAILKSIPDLDVYVIVRDDFFEMLINNEENLGKEIAKKHLVFYNHQLFYDLINEGTNNGFRI